MISRAAVFSRLAWHIAAMCGALSCPASPGVRILIRPAVRRAKLLPAEVEPAVALSLVLESRRSFAYLVHANLGIVLVVQGQEA